MADSEMSSATLVNEMARLDLQERSELAATLRHVSETFAEVSDGKVPSQVFGVLAHLLELG